MPYWWRSVPACSTSLRISASHTRSPIVCEVPHRRELHALCLIVDGLSLGHPPCRDPLLKVRDRLFANVHMERSDGAVGVRGGRVEGNDPRPFSHVKGDCLPVLDMRSQGAFLSVSGRCHVRARGHLAGCLCLCGPVAQTFGGRANEEGVAARITMATSLLPGQVFRSLLGEFPSEHPGGLADFDHVAVGVSHVAADLEHRDRSAA